MPSVTRKPQANREQGRQQRREQMERRLLDATERLMRDGAGFTELGVAGYRARRAFRAPAFTSISKTRAICFAG